MKPLLLCLAMSLALTACAHRKASNTAHAPVIINSETLDLQMQDALAKQSAMRGSPNGPIDAPPPAHPVRSVFVTSEPRDLLLEDRIRRQIDQSSDIRNSDLASADLILVANAYTFDFSDDGSNTEHISAAKYQLENLMGAAFFMPEASSYNIDVQHFKSAAAYELAFSITTIDRRRLADKVIRNQIEREATRCSQPTIINAFGGVTPASFWASNALKQTCSQSAEPPTKISLQGEADDDMGQQLRADLLHMAIPPKPETHAKKKSRAKTKVSAPPKNG